MSNSSYFKPFKHPTSEQTFYGSSSNRQSLFVISGGEQKRTFPVQPTAYPDILLSLGSGCEHERLDFTGQASHTGSRRRTSGTKRAGNPRGSDEGPQKSWHEFLSCLPVDAPLEKFVRIDPIMAKVPELCDLDSMNEFQSAINSYIDLEEVRKLALRLFACLFYYEPSEHTGTSLANDSCIQGT